MTPENEANKALEKLKNGSIAYIGCMLSGDAQIEELEAIHARALERMEQDKSEGRVIINASIEIISREAIALAANRIAKIGDKNE